MSSARGHDSSADTIDENARQDGCISNVAGSYKYLCDCRFRVVCCRIARVVDFIRTSQRPKRKTGSRYTRHECALASRCAFAGRFILPDGQRDSEQDREGSRGNEIYSERVPNANRSRGRGCSASERESELVAVTIINPHKYKKFAYSTTPRKNKLGIEVESNVPIDVYIVQSSDLATWRTGHGDYGGIAFQSTKLVDAQVNIPKDFDGDWYLILENSGEKQAAVHYELFDL